MSRSNIQQENHIASNFILITIHMNYKQIIDYYLHEVKKKTCPYSAWLQGEMMSLVIIVYLDLYQLLNWLAAYRAIV